jgi:hypothetical protein
MKPKLIKALLIATCALLAACVSPSAPQTESKPVAKAQPNTPSILIIGRSNKAVIEDIIRYRTGKGMKVLSRSATRLEFSSNITKANIPTEARIQYTLTQVTQGWQLSAKVFQISYPATKNEKVDDITSHVAEKLNDELARYVTN